jgi:hypothetical protein
MESTEETSLLAQPFSSSGGPVRHSYLSAATANDGTRTDDEPPMPMSLPALSAAAVRRANEESFGLEADDSLEQEYAASARSMLRRSVLVIAVVAGAMFYYSGSSSMNASVRTAGMSAPMADLVPINTEAGQDPARPGSSRGVVLSFQQLASLRVPSLYRNMSEQAVPVLTDNMQPADVYASRKLILKTRDLLDVFSPVYPNSTTLEGVDVDLWDLVRNLLDRGYEVIGEFQDLDHAHIEYTQEMFNGARGTVLQWRRDFDDFHRQYGLDTILGFLQSPSPNSYRHRESRLFWKTIDALPSGSDAAPASLHVLGSRQTATALVYLTLSFQYDSVLGTVAHEHYHNLRKELRSMTDEYDLLGTFMFPKSCLPSIKRFKEARQILGDINDKWTAYDDYVTYNMYRSEQKDLAKEIDRAWQGFRIWVEETDFEGTIRNVTMSMQHDLRFTDEDDTSSGKTVVVTDVSILQ